MENTQPASQRVRIRNIDDFKTYAKVYAYLTFREEDLRMIATTIGIDHSQYSKMELIEKLMKYKLS